MIRDVDLFVDGDMLCFNTHCGMFVYDLYQAESKAYEYWQDDFPEYVTNEKTLQFMEMSMQQRNDIFEDLCEYHNLEPMYVLINNKKYETKTI